MKKLSDKWTEERIGKKLAEINASVPSNLRANVFREVDAHPTVKFIVEKALSDPEFPEEKKQKLRTLVESGEFDKKRVVENPEISKKVDLYIGRKINEAIKNGELPPRHLIKQMTWLKKQSY